MTGLEPRTHAERTDYRETSRHRQVVEFIQALRARTPGLIVDSMGRSGEGQDIPVLLFGATSPEDARRRGKPVVLVIANIHAGEVEGKEVLLMLARDMTLGPLKRFPEKLCLVFIPNYNPDGNDRISPENRRLDLANFDGQVGPEGGVGTRYTGRGINLNRDYTKLEADESRHLARLYNRWWPDLTIDSHTSDGSIHRYHLTYDSANNAASCPPEPLRYVRKTMLPAISASLEKRTGLPTFFYGNFRDPNDPTKGWQTYSPLPRYGSNYRGLTGRMDVLLEAYSYIPFRERCVVTYEWLVECFDYVIAHASEILAVNAAATPRREVAINYGAEGWQGQDRLFTYSAEADGEVEIRSVDLEALKAHRLEGRPVNYRCPWLTRFVPRKTVVRPAAYLVRREASAAIRKLEDHGIRAEPASGDFDADVFRIESLGRSPSPDVGTEKRTETVVAVAVSRARIPAREGDVLVRTDQRLGTVAVVLLEPESDDGLVRWGYFDGLLAVGSDFPVARLSSAPSSRGEVDPAS